MTQTESGTGLPHMRIDTLVQFKQAINILMSKLTEGHSPQIVLESIKNFITVNVSNAERMNTLISSLAEHKENSKAAFKKEAVKIVGIMGEVFGAELISHLPRVLTYCYKKLEDPILHVPTSDSLGIMVHHVFKNIESAEAKTEVVRKLFDEMFSMLKTSNKSLQVGVAMCITRIIQNSPISSLLEGLGEISDQLLKSLKNPLIKCITELLEGLISLILVVEHDFAPYIDKYIPSLIDCMKDSHDWSTKKMAIDVIYTCATFVPNSITAEMTHIIRLLKILKADKVKQVREAAQEALMKVQEYQGNPFLGQVPKKVLPKETSERKNLHPIPEIKRNEGDDIAEENLEETHLQREREERVMFSGEDEKEGDRTGQPQGSSHLISESNLVEPIEPSKLGEGESHNSYEVSQLRGELDRIAKQQAQLIESMNAFQIMTKQTMGSLQARMNYFEEVMERLASSVAKNPSFSSSFRAEYSPKEVPSRKSEEAKQLSGKKEDSLLGKALAYINENRYNDAYNWVLGKRDDLLLIKLMGRTGVVIEYLDSENVEFLLTKVIDLISSGDFIDTLLPWIIAAVEKKITISVNTQYSIVDCINALLSEDGKKMHRLEPHQLGEAKKVFATLKENLKSIEDNFL